jgi:(1->4)-alpha-D-glucan 1-alpha-D-glucosylmutase
MSGRLRIPAASYRLQFNKNFRFEDARSLAPYLSRLGISDVYASPIFQARAGSSHGYDVTDPTRLNPELGSEKDFDALVETLKQYDMGLLLDIVPNHMAASPENPWWRDVTENGRDSRFARFFDLNWLDFGEAKDTVKGYRRFFDIGDMAGVRVEDLQVFDAIHSYILQLIKEGKVTGLRIDHIDGLYDPLEYLRRLQQRISSADKNPGFYIVVEKILSGNETLPADWPVYGTTGYDFSKTLNNLFVDSDGIEKLNRMYFQAIGTYTSFHDLVYEKKKLVMEELFREEITGLGCYLARLSGGLNVDEAVRAVTELTACLPVYRTYIHNMEVSTADRAYVESAEKGAIERKPGIKAALDLLRRVLLLDLPPDLAPQSQNERLNFIMRWQQFTGAVMAKGFEDTALYNYNCLISFNEVGGSPDTPGLSAEDYHKWNLSRAKCWPHALNATSTHDTKRSEDVRARINVLSEIPDEWEEHLNKWREWNGHNKLKSGGLEYPEPNTELLLYQTLIGAWPLLAEEVTGFKERLKTYMIKAVREAKAATSWIKVNREYEDALLGFTDSIFENSTDNTFLHDFIRFQAKIAFYGALNSLSQVLLKITTPGVPDFYQGTELWDFSLVDPDNRRPIDFVKRQNLLNSMILEKPTVDEMLASWQDGRIKLYVTFKTLDCRREYSSLFQKGEYIPLRVAGKRQECVCTFARRYGNRWALIAVPRFFTKLSKPGEFPLGRTAWQDDSILLPRKSPQRWDNVFTHETIEIPATGKAMNLADVFRTFPLALLVPSV